MAAREVRRRARPRHVLASQRCRIPEVFRARDRDYGASAGGDGGCIDAIRSRNLATSCLITGVKRRPHQGVVPVAAL
jgi:hypothetical protein